MSDLLIPEGITDESILSVFQKPEVQEALLRSVDKRETPLRQKRDELLASHTALNETLKSLGGLDTIKAAVAKVSESAAEAEKARLEAMKASGNVDEITKHYQKQLKEKDDELSSFKQTLVQKEVRSKLQSKIKEADGEPELLLDRLLSRVRSSLGPDGEVVIEVLNDKGAPALTDTGKAASLTDLVNEFKAHPSYGRAFAASGKTGAGSRPTTGAPGTANNPFDRKSPSFNVTQQMVMKKTDPMTARRLAMEAGVDVSRW